MSDGNVSFSSSNLFRDVMPKHNCAFVFVLYTGEYSIIFFTISSLCEVFHSSATFGQTTYFPFFPSLPSKPLPTQYPTLSLLESFRLLKTSSKVVFDSGVMNSHSRRSGLSPPIDSQIRVLAKTPSFQDFALNPILPGFHS